MRNVPPGTQTMSGNGGEPGGDSGSTMNSRAPPPRPGAVLVFGGMGGLLGSGGVRHRERADQRIGGNLLGEVLVESGGAHAIRDVVAGPSGERDEQRVSGGAHGSH